MRIALRNCLEDARLNLDIALAHGTDPVARMGRIVMAQQSLESALTDATMEALEDLRAKEPRT